MREAPASPPSKYPRPFSIPYEAEYVWRKAPPNGALLVSKIAGGVIVSVSL
ncbi:hypothetical protein Barb7_02362 [Bacteroidales bacterium Barb7]|nr:hypothetical protein Barb7_02362 [Bacteroidales bacterium Barb7]